jgi:hypothetical protein
MSLRMAPEKAGLLSLAGSMPLIIPCWMRFAMKTRKLIAGQLCLQLLLSYSALAWGPDGHRFVNRNAALHMPAEMPVFFRNAVDRLEYLGPEPDRWRSITEPSLKNAQEPEHFIDLELLDGFGDLPRKRFDYYQKLEAFRTSGAPPSAAVVAAGGQLSATQAKHDLLLPERVGLQPWITIEVYERLVVAFREYRQLLKEGKAPKPTEDNAIFYAGWLGHYVGDGANPMHTTISYNGWVGPNPHEYTTSKSTHFEFESRFVHDNVKSEDVAPLLHPASRVQGDVFVDYVDYLRENNTLIEKTYQLEKAGAFKGAGTPEGRDFVIHRLAAGSQKLIDLW